MTIPYLKTSLLILLCTTQSCKTVDPIEIRPFPTKNIPEHTFNSGLDKLKDSIVSFFSSENQNNNKYLNNIFYDFMNKDNQSEENKIFIPFQAETINTALFGKAHFSQPNSSNSIYLHNFGTPWPSKLYHSKDKPLRYRTAFIIELSTINDDSTKVSIIAEDPKILNGISSYGAHGAVARETKVGPTSIEEYSILLFIADKLGDKTLTPLKIPK